MEESKQGQEILDRVENQKTQENTQISNDTNKKIQQYQQEQNLEKKKNKFVKAIRIFSDIIFVPLFAVIIISSIIMYSAKMNNEVPSIFGYSAVRVLSSSMEPDLSKGDIVIVKFVKDNSTLQENDVIAFYAYKEPVTDGDLSDNTSGVGSSKSSIVIGGAQNVKQRVAAKDASPVYIHKIDKIATPISQNDPNYGKLFFHTTGNADNSDEMWIMEDYIVGLWNGETNSFICNILKFVASSTGSIVLVIVPSLILISLFGFSLYKDFKDYKKEKENEQKEESIRTDILKNIENKQKQENEKIEKLRQAERKSVLEEMKEKEQKQTEINKELPKVAPVEKTKLPPKAPANLPPKPKNLPPKAPVNLPPKK